MNIQDLTHQIIDFCRERDWDQFHTTKDMAVGLVTESAELLDLFRFKDEAEAQAMLKDLSKREKIEDELADVLFWVLRFAQKNEIDLESSFAAKMKKNIAKYPADQVRGSNRKYTEY